MQTPGAAISLTTDRGAYTPTDTVVVTLVNGSAASIFTTDHQTSCSIISLMLWMGSGWRPVGDCKMMIASRLIEVHPGETVRVTLAPGGGSLRPTPWPSGTYRATLRYTLARQFTGDAQTLESADFTVA